MRNQITPSSAFRIFDSQVNIGSGELENDPIKSGITPELILQLMSDSNIECSLIFPASRPSGFAEANREVGEYIRRNPQQFIGFGRIRSKPVKRANGFSASLPTRTVSKFGRLENRLPALRKKNSKNFDKQIRDDVLRCFDEYDLKGIKAHPDEDGYPARTVLEVLQSHRKPMLLHCGRGISLRRIENEIIRPFTMPVILAHMGGFPADRRMYLRALDLAKKYPHVYLNTSFVFYTYILELAITSCPTKILFGSDSPGVHPYTAVASILPLNVPDDVKQMVFRDNLLRLLEI